MGETAGVPTCFNRYDEFLQNVLVHYAIRSAIGKNLYLYFAISNYCMRTVAPSYSKLMSVPIQRQRESGFNTKPDILCKHFAVF
jgi:hypothetical protein